jgi:hypothetical protein
MYGMSTTGTGWILTLLVVGPTIGVCGLFVLLGHLVTEVKQVRVARWRAKEQEFILAAKKQETLQQKSIQAVEEAKVARLTLADDIESIQTELGTAKAIIAQIKEKGSPS